MGLDFPHFWAIKQDSQRKTESRILITKLWRSKFPDSSSFCHLDFFPPYILSFFFFSYILIPPHLGCAFILFFAVFAEFTVKTGDICRTYAGDIPEWSHVYSSKRDQRAESWSGLSPSGAHLPWGAEPHRGCECWLSWSPLNWHLSTLTSSPAAFSAPKFLSADLTWPFAPNAAPVRMIIPTQIHDL